MRFGLHDLWCLYEFEFVCSIDCILIHANIIFHLWFRITTANKHMNDANIINDIDGNTSKCK